MQRRWVMARVDADRNLLFGLLALQNNFVGRDALVAAFGAWVADKSREIGQILIQQGALDGDTHALLTALVAKHLEMHGGEPDRSLAQPPLLTCMTFNLTSL